MAKGLHIPSRGHYCIAVPDLVRIAPLAALQPKRPHLISPCRLSPAGEHEQ